MEGSWMVHATVVEIVKQCHIMSYYREAFRSGLSSRLHSPRGYAASR
jgi:hypothetical protein